MIKFCEPVNVILDQYYQKSSTHTQYQTFSLDSEEFRQKKSNPKTGGLLRGYG